MNFKKTVISNYGSILRLTWEKTTYSENIYFKMTRLTKKNLPIEESEVKMRKYYENLF
jgi:hypothetical protein